MLAGAALAGVLVAQSGALEVIEQTVYPGSRRSLGEFVGLDLLFGAPHLWILQAPPLIVGTNASELATGYFVLAIPAVAMAVGVRWSDVGRVRAPAAAAGAVAALMATWLVVDWPGFFSWLFPMTLVPPERMAQVVGLSATITFAFVLTAWCCRSAVAPHAGRRRVGRARGGRDDPRGLELRDPLPELPAWVVVIVGVLVALAILAVVWHPASPRALAVMPVLALVVVFAANPLQRGLGDLRNSTAAETVGAASDGLGDGEYLAADSLEVDALLMSNGVPALSGQQWLGPDEEAWRVLDPSGRSRSAWNRGASYVVFDWAPGEQPPSGPSPRTSSRCGPTPAATACALSGCGSPPRAARSTRRVSRRSVASSGVPPSSGSTPSRAGRPVTPVSSGVVKLASLETLSCDAGWRPWLFVKATTEDGLVGWSEVTDSHGSPTGLAGVVRDLAPLVVGRDPLAVEAIHWDLYRRTRQSPGSIVQKAIGGIENALLDLKGKALGVSVAELFGGPTRETIPLYWSHCGTTRARAWEVTGTPKLDSYDAVAALGREVVERGYGAFKTNIVVPGDEPRVLMPGFGRDGGIDRNPTPELLDALTRLLEAFREGTGGKAQPIVDLNFNLTTEGIVRVARALEPFDLAWLEVDSYDAAALAHARRRSPIPLCSGENLYTLRGFRPYLEAGAMDVASVDVIWNGFAQSLKIAALAETHEVACAPHNYYSHLATFIAAQWCAAIPNVRLLEIDVDDVPWREELTTAAPEIRDGTLVVPAGPGWGCDVVEDVLRAHPSRRDPRLGSTARRRSRGRRARRARASRPRGRRRRLPGRHTAPRCCLRARPASLPAGGARRALGEGRGHACPGHRLVRDAPRPPPHSSASRSAPPRSRSWWPPSSCRSPSCRPRSRLFDAIGRRRLGASCSRFSPLRGSWGSRSPRHGTSRTRSSRVERTGATTSSTPTRSAAQGHLLIDDPLAGEDERVFADPPAVGATYGSVLLLDGVVVVADDRLVVVSRCRC